MEKETVDTTVRSVNFERGYGSNLVSKAFPFILTGNEVAKKFSKFNFICTIIVIGIYIYLTMMPTTLVSFLNYFKNGVNEDFLFNTKFISVIFIIHCRNPTKILQTPPFYILLVFCVLYLIYFFIFLFCQRYLQNKLLRAYLFTLSGAMSSIPFLMAYTNSCFAAYFYFKSTNIYRWIYLLPIIVFILTLPGILLAITYSSFTIKHAQALSIVSPKSFFWFIILTNGLGGLKIFMVSDEFDQKYQSVLILLAITAVSLWFSVYIIIYPFACSILKRILYASAANALTGGYILSVFAPLFDNMSSTAYESISVCVGILSILLSIAIEVINVKKAKRFNLNDIITDDKITDNTFMKYLMYKDLYEQCTLSDEIIQTIFTRWPNSYQLHFYVLHLITTDKSRKKSYSKILTSLEQYCYTKQSAFDTLHLLLIMEYASKNEENDTTSYSRRTFLALIEKARYCQILFWNFILSATPAAAATVYPSIARLTTEIEDIYSQLPDEEKESDFYRTLYISFTSFISLNYKNIDNVYADYSSNDAYSHCFLTNEDGTVTSSIDEDGKEKLVFKMKGREYAGRVFERGNKLADQGESEKCEAINNEVNSYLRVERMVVLIVYLIGFILAIGFSLNIFVTFGRISSSKALTFSAIGDMYAFVDSVFWTAFDSYNSKYANSSYASVYASDFQDMKKTVHSVIEEDEEYQDEALHNNIHKVFNITEAILNESVVSKTTLSDLIQRDDYVQLCESLTLISCTVLNNSYTMVERFSDCIDSCNSFFTRYSKLFLLYFVVGMIVLIACTLKFYKKIEIITFQSLLVDRITLSKVYGLLTSSKFHGSRRMKLNEAVSLPLEMTSSLKVIGLFIVLFVVAAGFGLLEMTQVRNLYDLYYNYADACVIPCLMTTSTYDLGIFMLYDNVSSLLRSWLVYSYNNCICILSDADLYHDNDYYGKDDINVQFKFHFIQWRNILLTSDKNVSIHYKLKTRTFASTMHDIISIVDHKPDYLLRATFRRLFNGINDTKIYIEETQHSRAWCITMFRIAIVVSVGFTLIMIGLFIVALNVPISRFWKIRHLMRSVMVLPRKSNFFYRNEEGKLRVRITYPPFETLHDDVFNDMPIGACTTDEKGKLLSMNHHALDTFGDEDVISSIIQSGQLTEYTLASGEKRSFMIIRSPFMLDEYRTKIRGKYIISINDITDLKNSTTIFKQKDKELKELINTAFPLSLYNMGDSCSFLDGMTVVDIVFDPSKHLSEEEFAEFAYRAKVYAEQEYTFFTSNVTQWSICFVFSTFDTLSIENQHYKDAIEFATNIMTMRNDIKIGIVKTRKAFIIANKTKCPGILILSATPDLAHSITKRQPIGSVSVDTSIIENLFDDKEISFHRFYKEKTVYGYKVEFYVFPSRWAFEEMLFC